MNRQPTRSVSGSVSTGITPNSRGMIMTNHPPGLKNLVKVFLVTWTILFLAGIAFLAMLPHRAQAQSGSTGLDGSLVVTDTRYVDVDRYAMTEVITAGSVTLPFSSGLNIEPGDEVLIITMQGADAGTYETASVADVSGAVITLTTGLVHSYDGANDKVMVQRVPNYTDVTVENDGTLTAHAWDGQTGGAVFLRAVTVTVETSGTIDVSGKGYRGGNKGKTYAYQGESYTGTVSTSMSPNEGGGGAGRQQTSNSGGGGGGGYGTNGADAGTDSGINYGRGGIAYGSPTLGKIYLGSGGGGGAGYASTSCGAPGGAGGGILVIFAEEIDINGNLYANGNNGGNSPCDGGGGGGGSGGSIYLFAGHLILNTERVKAVGGSFGAPGWGTWRGGSGGDGRIRLDYNYLSGSTNPPHYQGPPPGGADLNLTLSGPAEASLGGIINYELTVQNNSVITAPTVVLTHTLPPSVTYGNASISPTSQIDQDLVWQLGELMSLESRNLVITGTVSPSASIGSSLVSTATVTSDLVEANLANNTAIFTTTVRGADLAVTKSGPSQAAIGQSILYNLSVENLGATPAEGVVVTDTLPASIEYLAHSAPVTPTINGSQVTWELGRLGGGESLGFALMGQVTETITPGETVQNVVQVGSLTPDEDTQNNAFTTTAQVIAPYSHTLTLDPATVTARLGATQTLRLRIANTGPLADVYTVSVTGLDPAWYTPITDSFPLNPGGLATADLKLHVADCLVTGTLPFTVAAHAQQAGSLAAAGATLILQTDPQQMDLTPAAGSKTGSQSVLFSWRTDAPTSGQLTLYPTASPTQTITRTTPLSTVHTLLVEDLSRNTQYTWWVDSASPCGQATSPQRTFSVGNGIVFVEHNPPPFDIHRDYGQLIPLTLRNEDSLVTHTLRLSVEHPYADLIAGFVGPGSVDDGAEYISLAPDATQVITLAIHAQDAEQVNYDLTAQVIADEDSPGNEIVDYAHLSVRVLRANNFTMTLVSEDPDTLVKTYQVKNLGLPITDLSVQALDPASGLPARALIQPALHHARLGKAGDPDDTLTFQVIPLFSPEDAVALQALSRMGAGGGLASPLPQVTGFDIKVVATVLDTVQELVGRYACLGDNQLYAVTLHNVWASYFNHDWYCTNRPSIDLDFPVPGNINVADILSATVSTSLSPRSAGVRPHDVRILFNGNQVGELLDQVPDGSYTFSVDPAFFNPSANPVQPVNQTLGLRTYHFNGGHYVVNTSSRLDLPLANYTRYVCAADDQEARDKAGQGFWPIPTQVDIQIVQPQAGAQLELGWPVVLEATVDDGHESYIYYPVLARIVYSDQPEDVKTVMLVPYSSSGTVDTYRGYWLPARAGEVSITQTVYAGIVSGSDNVEVTVEPEATFSISGQVTDAVSGEPIPGGVVSAGGTLSATTQPSGYYTITGVLSGTYTLKPTRTGYGFVPAARMVTVAGNIAGQNFIGGTDTYAITGTVTFIQTSLPVPTVTIRAVSKGTRSEHSATTDLTGVYTITDMPVGEYTVIASKGDYQFKPNPGEAIIINHDVRQDFTTDTPPPPPPPPVTGLRTGANFLRFPPAPETSYENTNIRWNLDLSDRIFLNQNVDGTDMFGGINALAQQGVWTVVRLKVGRPVYATGFNHTNDPNCEGLRNWIETQVEEQYNNANRGTQTPIFILDNEPNHLSEWHISAAEYAHAYNCYHQYWRVEQNRPQALYVAGPAQGVQTGEVGWEQYLRDLLYPTTGERIEFADGFAMHVYGHSPGGDGPEQRTFFNRWLTTTMSQITGRSDTDLHERPVIFSEYNPGAVEEFVHHPHDSWADWFNITYCWMQQSDRKYTPGIIGLLYFVDDEERNPTQQGTDSPWWEVSLENDTDFNDSRITLEDWQQRRDHWLTLGTPRQMPPVYAPNQADDDCVLQQASLSRFLASPLQSPTAQAAPSIGGVISGTLGLPRHYNVYHVTADLEVPVDERLTINPSTYLVFDSGRRLIVNGQLIAEGNTVFPIRFMSTDEAGWNGLHFQSSAQGSRCLGCYLENLANGSVALEVHAPVTFQYGLIRDVPDGTAISSTIPFTLSNVVIDYTGTGLRLSGSPTTTHTISHLTLSRCQQGVVNQGQDLLLDNSIITDCSVAVSTELSGTTTISYTLLYNNSRDFNTASGAQLVQGPGLLSANPNFVNFPDDFHLAANSPAINAANPQADYSREPGYNGNRANLGAYGNTWEATESPPLSQMGILLSADVSQRTGLPGQILTYTLTLTNSGSITETYTLIADDNNTAFKSSLFADGQQAPWSIKLSPQQEISVTVWVEVPANVTRWPTNTTLVFVGNRYGVEDEVELTTQVAAFQESGGQVIMETEHFVGFDERTGRSWLTQRALGGYVGPGYLGALPDTDLQFTPIYTNTSPEVRYTIHFTATGTYYLWLRGYAPNGAGDSLYIALDDQPAKVLTGFAPQAWQWANSDVQLSSNPVTINVTEAGLHTLHLWQREDGLRLDRILLTRDDSYIPTGDGPPESDFE
jgi:uncharacterized repeat protein (TIGR01451 family)